jgi:TnpA family transposase
MAEACPGISASVLSRIATWHIREETYTNALAEIVNHHHHIEFAGHWGDGSTSSSDGQRFRTGGFRFAPRIRHVGETRLFSVEKSSHYPTFEKLIGGAISTKQITAHWDEALRLTSSIQQGTVTASLMLRKLVPTHVRTHSLWLYGKSGNWNARCFCWTKSRTSNYESAFMLA